MSVVIRHNVDGVHHTRDRATLLDRGARGDRRHRWPVSGPEVVAADRFGRGQSVRSVTLGIRGTSG